jgi:hypothetical protein
VRTGTGARARARNVALLSACCLVGATCLAACSTSHTGGDGSEGARSVSIPLATSVQSPDGTWATVPMGYLGQQLNTFWQLLFEPAGTTRWSNHVEATAAATNGGIVLAPASDGALLAGVRPSNLLEYSPLIVSSNGGTSWSNGVLDEGLAAYPDALAAHSSDEALGLVAGVGGAEVLRSAGSLTSWQKLTDERELESSTAGRTCAVRTITGVAYLGEAPVVGAACGKAGVVGILELRAGRWELRGPALAQGLRSASTEVLNLRSEGTGLAALVALRAKGGVDLVAAWMNDGKWTTSPPLPFGGNDEQLASFGAASGSGLFVLLDNRSGAQRLYVVGPSATWQRLPSPPATTETVAFGAGTTIDALAVHNSVLRVWTLAAGSRAWTLGQVVDVAIQYGSSS